MLVILHVIQREVVAQLTMLLQQQNYFQSSLIVIVDILDSCMSDVHCHICVLISYKNDANVNNKENNKYCIKNYAKTRWNQEHYNII